MADSKTPKDDILEYAESFINAVREPLVVLDQDFRVISASRSFYDVFQLKPEETVGRLIYDLGNQQWDIPELRQLLENILPQKTTLDDYEVEHEFADIGRRTMLFNAREIQKGSGKQRLILLAIEDITARQRAEDQLSESEERYRRLFETANDGILLLEKGGGKITHANPAIEKMLGYSPDELIGKGLVYIGFPKDIGTIQEISQTLEKDGILHYEDAPVQAKWGQVIDTDVYMVDKARLVQCNIRDITERKRMARVIEKERNYLSAVIDNIGEALVICDAEGRIVRFNETVRRLHGLPEQPIPSDQWFRYYDLYQKDGVTPLAKGDIPLFRALQGERVRNAEIIVAPGNSRPSFLDCNGQALTDEAGKIYGAVVVMNDITERKRMEKALRRERDLTQRYLYTTQTIMVALDTEGRITMINRAGCELLGYAEDEILGCNWFETCLPQPEGRDSVLPVFRRLIASDLSSAEYFENSVVCRDGTQRLMGWHNAFLEDDDGRIVGILSSGEDITDRKHAEQQLKESEERLRSITESTGDAIIMMDNRGAISFWNPAATEILGYRPEEAIGQDLHEMLAPQRYHEAVRSALPAFLETGCGNLVGKKVELSALKKNGCEISVALTLSAVFLQEQWHAVGILRDITGQKNMEKELARLAETDNLTGLFNRRIFMERFAHEISRCQRYGKAAVLMMLDLDRFKKVNDTYGHAAGDKVIRQLSRILRENVRETDVPGRVGGEEFTVLLPETTVDAAMPVARRLLHQIRKSAVVVDDEEIRFTASIGVAQLRADDADPEILLARADAAMYQAKDKGRDRVEVKK